MHSRAFPIAKIWFEGTKPKIRFLSPYFNKLTFFERIIPKSCIDRDWTLWFASNDDEISSIRFENSGYISSGEKRTIEKDETKNERKLSEKFGENDDLLKYQKVVSMT
jgi:hypothetical protein